jgi:hypothetical protein
VGSEYVVTTVKSNGNPVTQYYVTKKGDSKIVNIMRCILEDLADLFYSTSLRISQVRLYIFNLLVRNLAFYEIRRTPRAGLLDHSSLTYFQQEKSNQVNSAS